VLALFEKCINRIRRIHIEMNAGQQAPQSFLQNLFEPTLRIIVIDQRNPLTPNCSLLTPRMWKPPAILAAI